MAKKVSVFLIIFVVASIAALAQSAFDKKLKSLYKNTVPQIEAEAIKPKIGKGVVLLDTRSEEEYRVSHIPGAALVNYDKFNSKDVQQIDRQAEVIVYCTVGYRSERIGEKLLEMGFTNVKNLYGGIFNWVNEEGTLINNLDQPTDSVHTYSKSWSPYLERGVKVY